MTSYAKSYSNCKSGTAGSDALCITTSNPDACCFYFEIVEKLAESYTSQQQTYKDAYKQIGYPQEKGESGYFCLPKKTYEVFASYSALGWADPLTGDTTKGYCAGALTLKAVGAMASLIIIGSY